MDQNFNIELYKLKKVMSQVKNAIIKKESIPVLFGDHVGQIILAKNKVVVINPTIFVEIETPIKIKGDIGICVPDGFYDYINAVKNKGDEKIISFELIDNQLILSISTDKDGTNVTFTVKVIDNINDVIPSCPSEADLDTLPELFHTGIVFCEKFTSKAKAQTSNNFVWCVQDKIMSTDDMRIAVVDLEKEFNTEFCLSSSAIKLLKDMEVSEYVIDKKRYAYFYGPGIVVGIRQFNSESIIEYLTNVDNYQPHYTIKIPKEIEEKLSEIKTVVDKKKNSSIIVSESNGMMTISGVSGNIKKKNEILVKAPSENDVDYDLVLGFDINHFDEILKVMKVFDVSEDLGISRVITGNEGCFQLFTGMAKSY